MDNEAKAPQMIKAVLLPTLVNIIGANDDAAKLTAPWIIAWCLGCINVLDLSEANCQKKNNYVSQDNEKGSYLLLPLEMYLHKW